MVFDFIGQAKKETKACLNLELTVGKEISSGKGFTFAKTCTDKNKTVVWKLHEGRERFKLPNIEYPMAFEASFLNCFRNQPRIEFSSKSRSVGSLLPKGYSWQL